MSSSFDPLNPPKRLLYGPGPSMVHPRVYQAMAKPIVSHLDPYFFKVTQDVCELLRMAFGTTNPWTLAISATGSAGMETAVANFTEPGAKFAVLANGYFCDRISEMARRHSANLVRLEKPWGEIFSDDEARDFIKREKPQIVAYVHAETSTGALQPGKAICEAAHEVGALVIADCVTSLVAMPVNVDETGIDIAYSCSQKGIGCPPGLSPMTLSPRAVERLRARQAPISTWYLDLKLLDEYYTGAHRYHHTAPISMFYALREALMVIAEKGIENCWKRHRRSHEAFVKGIEALGMRMLVPEPNRVWNLNTPVVPDGIDDAKVRKHLFDNFGIEIPGGFGPLTGKVFRIGLMSSLATEESVAFFLERFAESLAAAGYHAGKAAAR